MEQATIEPPVSTPAFYLHRASVGFQNGPMIILPQKWAVRMSALDNLEHPVAPPEMPEWTEKPFPRSLVGTSKCAYLIWDSEHNIFKGNASFEPAYLAVTLEEPFYKVENSSGITLKADQWIPSEAYSTEPALLELALQLMVRFEKDYKKSVQTFKQAMYDYRCARRTWEFDLLSAIAEKGGDTPFLVNPTDSFVLEHAKKWVEEENSKDSAEAKEWWIHSNLAGPLGATAISKNHCEKGNWIKNTIPPMMRNLAYAVQYLQDRTGIMASEAEDESGDQTGDLKEASAKGKKPQKRKRSTKEEREQRLSNILHRALTRGDKDTESADQPAGDAEKAGSLFSDGRGLSNLGDSDLSEMDDSELDRLSESLRGSPKKRKITPESGADVNEPLQTP